MNLTAARTCVCMVYHHEYYLAHFFVELITRNRKIVARNVSKWLKSLKCIPFRYLLDSVRIMYRVTYSTFSFSVVFNKKKQIPSKWIFCSLLLTLRWHEYYMLRGYHQSFNRICHGYGTFRFELNEIVMTSALANDNSQQKRKSFFSVVLLLHWDCVINDYEFWWVHFTLSTA